MVSVTSSSLVIEFADRWTVVSGGDEPDSVRSRRCGWPLTVAVARTVVAVSPGVTNAEVGDRSTVNRFGPPASPQMGCAIAHVLPSFDHVDCIAKDPVASATFWAWPGPSESHTHLSAFSKLSLSNQPPRAWSVSVSAYSWPSTIVTPS